MYARLTLLEIDTMRIDIDSALTMYQEQVVPEMRNQPGYLGVIALTTPTGAAALVSFWGTAEAAEAGRLTGFYADILERYTTIFRSPPGRESYEVAFAELPETIMT
jgi:heme-degrading monooxygenase HmoA